MMATAITPFCTKGGGAQVPICEFQLAGRRAYLRTFCQVRA